MKLTGDVQNSHFCMGIAAEEHNDKPIWFPSGN